MIEMLGTGFLVVSAIVLIGGAFFTFGFLWGMSGPCPRCQARSEMQKQIDETWAEYEKRTGLK